ncbi:MAG: DNA-processing protein DprA [Phycisphaerales bacterium]
MVIDNAISPYSEMLAYETLWALPSVSLKTIADWVRVKSALPSALLDACRKESMFSEVDELAEKVRLFLSKIEIPFSICVHGTFQYPERLRDARYPLELFYYRGDIGLLESKCISVVGARECTEDGAKRAAKLARGLVQRGFTVVSGLAKGIDTAAMTAAIDEGGSTIGVIGTPLDTNYPKENEGLQATVAAKHLLVSQVPFYRYHHEIFPARRVYFPQRNETMAALSEATVIVEASDTSGTLTQARACLQQGRKLFILNSCFENPSISWPAKYEKEGAIRVRDFEDIFSVIGKAKIGG